MALPLPPAFRKKMDLNNPDASASDQEPNPLGVSESESDAPEMKGDKPNPLKRWAQTRLGG